VPYDKVRNHPDCGSGQIAVVKKGSGDRLGCHDSEKSADEQIAAIHAREGAQVTEVLTEDTLGRGDPSPGTPADDRLKRNKKKRDYDGDDVEGLEVVPRTSVFALKDRREDVRAIGDLLGVSTVLEGTVQRAVAAAIPGYIFEARARPNEFVASDNPLAAFEARRLVPPWLADPSGTRVDAGSLTAATLIEQIERFAREVTPALRGAR